jgi:hypothetical protein
MLVALGFLMIAVFMYLIMSHRLTPVAALILVPVTFGLFAGAGLGMSDMIMEAFEKLAPNAGLLFFAIIFFGMMIDVGLFATASAPSTWSRRRPPQPSAAAARRTSASCPSTSTAPQPATPAASTPTWSAPTPAPGSCGSTSPSPPP